MKGKNLTIKKIKLMAAGIYLIFLIILILNSCILAEEKGPPFAFSYPVYKAGQQENACLLGAVYFDFYNKAKVPVVQMEIRMNVYDKSSKKNAFSGAGTIISKAEVNIEAGEKRNLCISLDDYILTASDRELLIDNFYISRLSYKDESDWKDYFGIYSAR